ncbi:MAG: glucose-6-phosphate isomerase [Clostridiales bacterium]|nr:glucose-6-phosphate isomerase [Clostridiales bacterium]
MSVTISLKNAESFFSKTVYEQMSKKALESYRKLINKTGIGSEYTGWVNLPNELKDKELDAIKVTADEIKSMSSVLVVVGIGGSYLGARAALEFLKPVLCGRCKQDVEVLFAGNNLSSDYLSELLNNIKDKDFSINVISKSGTTTESAVAFRIFKNLLYKKYGEEEGRKRIVVTTDEKNGPLTKFAEKSGYRRFFIPSSVGGRYSVLSAVGLLPMAVSGIDIREVVKGAKDALGALHIEDIRNNAAILYAIARNSLYYSGKTTEIFGSFEPHTIFFAEWWKQLFGESEGKEYGGIFPASVTLTADLHSMGQYIQEGKRNIFETLVEIAAPENEMIIPFEKDDFDGLNYLAESKLSYINLQAMQAVSIAHLDGGVPIIKLSMPRADEYHFGYLVYFFEFACGISGYMQDVNPFNQPGVEDYKINMFALLGKKGYEEKANELKNRFY